MTSLILSARLTQLHFKVLLAVMLMYPFVTSYAQKKQFDVSTLKARGLNTMTAEYFASESKFLPGVVPVSVRFNGQDKGVISARFGEQGELCADAVFLARVGLKSIPGKGSEKKKTGLCLSYTDYYPETVITLSPNEERVDIVAPQSALAHLKMQGYEQGGLAGILNYSLFSTQNYFSGKKNSNSQGAFELGLNLNDWVIRNRQFIQVSEGSVTHNSLYTYVQRALTSIGMTLQAGQININNTLFAGAPITGMQLFPENGLVKEASASNVTVTGIARTAQARVDIRQSGILIYSTLVPAGFFTLTNIPVISRVADLGVTVEETNGQKSTFTVSANMFTGVEGRMVSPQGFSFALGQVSNISATDNHPMVASMSNGWPLSEWANVGSGAMAAPGYQALGAQVDLYPVQSLMLSMSFLGDKSDISSGTRTMLRAGYQTPFNFNISAAMSQNSPGYRELMDTLVQKNDKRSTYSKKEYNVALNWSHPAFGGLSIGYSSDQGFDAPYKSQRLIGSWNRSFGYASLSVNWQHAIGKSSLYSNNDDSIYVSVSIPLREHSINMYVRNRGNDTAAGMGINGEINQDVKYSLSSEHNMNNQQSNVSGGVNTNLHYTQLGLNASVNSNDSRTYSATLHGGIAAHGDGVTLSPSAIRDTFAVASFNEPVSGIAINTPQGTVWTDFKGRAIIPSLTPYQSSRIELNVNSLPKNIDIGNGSRQLTAGYGAVPKLSFETISTRRVMLNVTLPNGNKLPKETLIVDEKQNYVSTAVADGIVFINNMQPKKFFIALTDNEREQCRLDYKLPADADFNVYYETLDAICRPLQG